MRQTIRLAERASELHQDDRKIEADRYFRDADESIEHCYEGTKAWLTNSATHNSEWRLGTTGLSVLGAEIDYRSSRHIEKSSLRGALSYLQTA